MSYEIKKAVYLGHDSKFIPILIKDQNNKVIQTINFYGNTSKAHKKAKEIISELEKEENN